MFDRIRDAKRLWKALGIYEKVKKEAELKDTKHLLMSKTFWANMLMMVLTVADVLPPKYAAVVIPLANVGLRLVSSTPLTLLPQPKE